MYWNQGNRIRKNNNNNSNIDNNKIRAATERKKLSIRTNYCFAIRKETKIVYDCMMFACIK